MNNLNNTIRNIFPIYQKYPDLNYLDNGATTHKPDVMLNALIEYYTHFNSNVGRGAYPLASLSDKAYETSKEKIASYFHANINNIIYTSGATESSNLAISLIAQKLEYGKGKIVTSVLEHHSSFLPLQNLAKQFNLEFIVLDDIEILSNPYLLPANFLKDVKVLGLTHVSNTTGRILPIEQWAKISKNHNIISIIDGSQAVSSLDIDIHKLNVDFYYFSAHKVYGPMGLGVLFISDEFKKLNPYKLGGGIVDYVTINDYSLIDSINKFEAGTPNVANAYAFASSLDFLNENKLLIKQQHDLSEYLFNNLKNISTQNYKIQILDQQDRENHPHDFSSLLSFVVLNKNANERGLHSHDIGSYLTENGICVRFGQHCAHPLHTTYNVSSSIRVSLGIYNNKSDIDNFLKVLEDGLNIFDSI